MTAGIALYHSASSTCSQKVRLLLAEKRLPWYSHPLDLARLEQLSDRFLALNPAGMVPVLVHDGAVIRESTVISEYIEDRFPDRPMRPADPAGRARMREWTQRISQIATGAIKIPSFNVKLKARAQAFDAQALALIEARMPDREAAARWLRIARGGHGNSQIRASLDILGRLLDQAAAALDRDRWLAGTDLSLADLDLAPFTHRLAEIGQQAMITARPSLARWYGDLASRPSFRIAMHLGSPGLIAAPAPP